MSRRVLIVFGWHEGDVRGHLQQQLEAGGDEKVEVDTATTVRAAADKFIRQRRQPYHLVVCGLSLAPGPKAAVNDRGGLLLLEAMRGLRPGTRRMLVVPALAEDVEKRCAVLPIPVLIQQLGADLVDRVRAALSAKQAAAARPERAAAPLNVFIHARQGSHWKYELRNGAAAKPRTGTLRVNEQFSNVLAELSDGVHNAGERWNRPFKTLGESLIQHFCGRENPKFGRDIRSALKKVERVENTRVSFFVEEEHYNIALEAMLTPNIPVPWMVRAPLFRSVPTEAQRAPGLFSLGRNSTRALIVCADASGFVNTLVDQDGNVKPYGELKMVQKECLRLARMFSAMRRRGLPVEAVPFPPPGRERFDPPELLRILEEPWDIVHIAGHSVHLQDQKRGVLLVGGRDRAVELDIAKVAPFLARTGLLYLSSCESGNAPFAVAAAEAGVPAVVGYRWPVNDGLAAIQAQLFYRSLFKHRSVEVAFLRTRRAMHRRYQGKLIWASSMLLMDGLEQDGRSASIVRGKPAALHRGVRVAPRRRALVVEN